MATPPVDNLPANPTIPLSPEAKAAYQALEETIQAGIDSTMDVAAIQALNAWWAEAVSYTHLDVYKRQDGCTDLGQLALYQGAAFSRAGMRFLKESGL